MGLSVRKQLSYPVIHYIYLSFENINLLSKDRFRSASFYFKKLFYPCAIQGTLRCRGGKS